MTGATSGIGRAIAMRLAQRGATVAVLGRSASGAEAVAGEVQDAGGNPWVATLDVTDAASVDAVVQRFVDEFGGMDTVVASAGIAVTGTATTTSVEDWRRTLDTNLSGAFYLARSTLPELVKTRGTFTAISSDAGVQGACGFAAYCASKHGLQGLVKCLALDYGRYGVRYNAVSPGFVETPMADQVFKDATPAEIAYYKSSVPLGRFSRPAKFVEVVAHLTA